MKASNYRIEAYMGRTNSLYPRAAALALAIVFSLLLRSEVFSNGFTSDGRAGVPSRVVAGLATAAGTSGFMASPVTPINEGNGEFKPFACSVTTRTFPVIPIEPTIMAETGEVRLSPGAQKQFEFDENGNLALHISNQSFEIDPVDISVYIDNYLAINEPFYVGTQHSYRSYRLSIPRGEHIVRVESKNGNASFEEAILVSGKNRIILHYNYDPKGSGPKYVTHPYFTMDFGPDAPLEID